MIRRYRHKGQPGTEKSKSIAYIVMGIAMVVYAVPKLPTFSVTGAGLFTFVWLLFALLVIASNLYYIIGVDREVREELEREEVIAVEQHHRRLLMRDE